MNAYAAFRFVPLFVISILIISCSDDDPVSPPPPAEPGVFFQADTLYATPLDSVLLSATVSGEAQNEALLFTFGDNNQLADPGITASRTTATHLYHSLGTYTVILTSGTEWADTCLVIVQDYVRPSRAKNVFVSIEGVQRVFEYTLFNTATNEVDSTWQVVEDGYTQFVSALTGNEEETFFDWNNTQRCNYQFGTAPNQSLSHRYSMSASMQLSPDGSRIVLLEMRYSYSDHALDGVVVKSYTSSLSIGGIPLDAAIQPAREGATYTWTGTFDELASHLLGYEIVEIEYGETERRGIQLVDVTGGGEVTLKVEFADR